MSFTPATAPHSNADTRKSYTTDVFCLKASNFSESDKILRLYSPEFGRISAIAKGARKEKSKLRGACELLTHQHVLITRGKSLDILTQFEVRQTYLNIRTDLLKLAYASLFADLIDMMATENDADSHLVFNLLQDCLNQLNSTPTEPDSTNTTSFSPFVAIHFMMQLLDVSGYLPAFERCLHDDSAFDPNELYYAFAVEDGGIIHPDHRNHWPQSRLVNIASDTISALLALHHAEFPLPLNENTPITRATLEKAHKFMRFYFEAKLEKRVKSFDFIFQLIDSNPEWLEPPKSNVTIH